MAKSLLDWEVLAPPPPSYDALPIPCPRRIPVDSGLHYTMLEQAKLFFGTERSNSGVFFSNVRTVTHI